QTRKNQTPAPRIYVERTLGLHKPDAIHHTENISFSALGSLLQVGVHSLFRRSTAVEQQTFMLPIASPLASFTVIVCLSVQLLFDKSPEQCSDCVEQYGKLFFPSLTAFMSSGFIAHWKTCPTAPRPGRHPEWSVRIKIPATCACRLFPSLRAKYGASDLRNAMHVSVSFSSAEREIKLMFPKCGNTHLKLNLDKRELLLLPARPAR
ncbi:nucleoside diphosphate kinase homolog 5-like, partial [Salvelinus alpinus]|uniref:nucleoside diphosphate kinase homolog 5-like n=1 Tax=Salvelinus alpinus TaxID=8036 RepID=UPI0039FC63C1